MSRCACIKKREFDIAVSHKGCEFLVLEDQSVWVSGDGFSKPSTYNVTIKVLSRGVEVTLPISTEKKTFLTSKELFNSLDSKCLPDDIYCITTESCGYKLTINRAYLCNLEVKINELVYKYAEDMDSEQRDIITDLKLKAESIKINAEQGNLEIAKRLFKSVKDKLKSYHCDNC